MPGMPAGKWLRGQDSNLRPPAYEAGELPLLHLAIDSCCCIQVLDQAGRDAVERVRIFAEAMMIGAALLTWLADSLCHLRGLLRFGAEHIRPKLVAAYPAQLFDLKHPVCRNPRPLRNGLSRDVQRACQIRRAARTINSFFES